MTSELKKLTRCHWCEGDVLYTDYHDNEWGVVERDSQQLFAFLCLEGAQAGLSWITILRRRDAYYKAFHNFEIARVAAMTDADIDQLLDNPGVIRHRGKLQSVVGNARAVLALQDEGTNLSDFLWQFAPPAAIDRSVTAETIPSSSAESRAMSRALKQRGFKFVGETICYAFMQAVGMVNDHVDDCYRQLICEQIAQLKAR